MDLAASQIECLIQLESWLGWTQYLTIFIFHRLWAIDQWHVWCGLFWIDKFWLPVLCIYIQLSADAVCPFYAISHSLTPSPNPPIHLHQSITCPLPLPSHPNSLASPLPSKQSCSSTPREWQITTAYQQQPTINHLSRQRAYIFSYHPIINYWHTPKAHFIWVLNSFYAYDCGEDR